MKQALAIVSLIVVLAAGRLDAEIIDRMVAVVNNRVITLSDLRLAQQVNAVLGKPVIDEKELVRELIDAQLIEEQMTQFFGIEVTEANVDEALKAIPDLGGLSPGVVRDAIRRRLSIDQFFELRFRQFL